MRSVDDHGDERPGDARLGETRPGVASTGPPPRVTTGAIRWSRRHLFRGPLDTLLTITIAGGVGYLVWLFYVWGIDTAVWDAASRRECLDRSPTGACWAGVISWFDRYLYGRYPDIEIWRVDLALAIFVLWMAPLWLPKVRAKVGVAMGVVLLYPFWAVALFHGGERSLFLQVMMSAAITGFVLTLVHTVTCMVLGRGYWTVIIAMAGQLTVPEKARISLVIAGIAVLWLAIFWLSVGWTVPEVNTYKWGGLFLTLVVSGIAIATALPAGIILALGRRSRMPLIRALCIGYIEVVRSVPLVTLMFMATTMFPVMMPQGVTLDKLALAIISVCMFAAAYMAETVRGGIQAIPFGQTEAAQAMGLRYWHAMGLIILPQALRAMIPNIVGSFISLFKGTAVISIFGFYDLTNMLSAVSQSPRWIMLFYEPLFVGASMYFIGCFAMSRYSLYLERKLGVGGRH